MRAEQDLAGLCTRRAFVGTGALAGTAALARALVLEHLGLGADVLPRIPDSNRGNLP